MGKLFSEEGLKQASKADKYQWMTLEQLQALDLNKLDSFELVLYAERMKELGHEELWLDSLKVVCIHEENNPLVSYANVCFDVVTALRRLGDYDEAAHYQRIAIRRDMQYDRGMNAVSNQSDLGEIFIEQGNYEASLKIFQDLIQKHPREIYTYSNLALTWLEVGFPELTLDAANKALEISLITNDKEKLADQLQKIINEAKVLKPRKPHKLMTRDTYQKWQSLLTSPLPPGIIE